MKLLTFSVHGQPRPGVLDGDDIIDLAVAGLPAGGEGDLSAIVAGGDAMLERVRDAMKSAAAKRYPLEGARIMAPIFSPSKIVAVGLNYIDHCKEANLPVPTEPVLFAKFPNSITGPFDDLSWPETFSREVDYEVELGVVIGKRGVNISESQALDYVCGYTTVNDVSARDQQFANAKQWDRGKSFDTSCPYGPYIVTRDEISDPQTLQVRTILNGQEMQISNTRNMVFAVAKLISYISEGTTLMPGDLIPTGTPFGVGFSRKPPVYLKHGDECVCEVEKVGAIRNRVRLR
ncbi:MAG: 5-carboxymethyl-2-hydroxymuconate delta-isomerase [Betaproteobacteria bacterium]|nr:5-carboxymethyl-2-hydroxymuconate delta-isomerase [Betaproteobacteria bacterium]